LLDQHKGQPFSYPDVGATRTTPPAGWLINHMCERIGKGRALHERAVAALFSWQLLQIDGLEVFPSSTTLQPNTNVAIRSRHFGIWSVDFCRVIYVLQDEPQKDGAVLRTGFAYGTLPGHGRSLVRHLLFFAAGHAAGSAGRTHRACDAAAICPRLSRKSGPDRNVQRMTR
jgi:uncharacterized protein (UPF0548 family)